MMLGYQCRRQSRFKLDINWGFIGFHLCLPVLYSSFSFGTRCSCGVCKSSVVCAMERIKRISSVFCFLASLHVFFLFPHQHDFLPCRIMCSLFLFYFFWPLGKFWPSSTKAFGVFSLKNDSGMCCCLFNYYP